MSDAGPLIALARVDLLCVLEALLDEVLIPQPVLEELELASGRPGTKALSIAAGRKGWLRVRRVSRVRPSLSGALDRGEAEAIALAHREKAPLLMDEKKGRRYASAANVSVVGTGGTLVAAKEKGLLDSVADVLERLAAARYRMAPTIVRRILKIAGEV